MNTKVFLREENQFITVCITDVDKPIITDIMQKKWQRIINIIARLLNVPSGLIMKINQETMEVFVKSDGEQNPYEVGGTDSLGRGLYCETVIGRDDALLIDNALEYDAWKDNPDVEINMIAYYGLPIKWPDESFFGTICALDDKKNLFTETYRELMIEFKESLENDLALLMNSSEMEYLANYDTLTGVYNRRKIETTLKDEFNRFVRLNSIYSVIIFDLDNFKYVNDNLGHEVGDELLVMFADIIRSNIRVIDTFGRYGGDEFLLICPGTDKSGVEILMSKIEQLVLDKMHSISEKIGFSYGISSVDSTTENANDVVKQADKNMYKMKSEHKKDAQT